MTDVETPNGLKGYSQGRVLLGCFLGVASGYSSAYFYSSGLLLVPISRDLSLSRGDTTLALLASSVTAAIMAPFIGRWVDRVGPRVIGLSSMIGLAVSFIICTLLTRDLGTLIASSIVISLLGAGSSSVSFSRLVVDTFEKRRGLALAVMQTGAGLGAFFIPFLLASPLETGDWRAAYRLLAAVVVGTAVVASLLLGVKSARPSAPSHTRQASSDRGRDIWLQRPFLILAGTFILAANAIAASVVHFAPMMIDQGLTPAHAAKLASLLGIALICSRLATGWLLDRLVPEFVAAGLFTVTALGLLVLATAGSGMAVAGALVIGLAMGSEVDLLCYLTARHFPRERYGTAYGGLFGVFLIGSAIGPSVMGYLFDYTGSYRVGLTVAAATLIAAAGLAVMLRRLHPRARSSEESLDA